MAKEYGVVFATMQQTMIATGEFPKLKIGMENKYAMFERVGTSSTHAVGDQLKYFLNVMKRGRATNTTVTGDVMNDIQTRMNNANQTEFDTMEMVRGLSREMFWKYTQGEVVDFSDGEAEYFKPLNLKMEQRLREGEENATIKIFTTVNQISGEIDLAATDRITEIKKFRDLKQDLEDIVDEYKYGATGDIRVLVHPRMVNIFDDVRGFEYLNSKDVFEKGAAPVFTWNNITFHVDSSLKTFDTFGITGSASTGAGTHVAGAILMDKDSYINAGLENGVMEYDHNFFEYRFIGNIYSELDAVVFPHRIRLLEIKGVAQIRINDQAPVIPLATTIVTNSDPIEDFDPEEDEE